MASPPNPPRFHDPVVVQSKTRNVLRLEVLVSVTIPGRLCRVLLPLLSSVCGVGKREKGRETVNDVVSVPRHVKRVRPVEHSSDLKEVLLGVVGRELDDSRDGAVVEYEGLPATIKHVMDTFARQAGDELQKLPPDLTYALRNVPVVPPDDVATRDVWSALYWPVSMKLPDKQGRKEHAVLSEEEIELMRRHMERVWDMSRAAMSMSSGAAAARRTGRCCACVIVDPNRNMVVGRGVDTTHLHPLGHAVMNAIDDVAAWQIETWYPESKGCVHRKEGGKSHVERRGKVDPEIDGEMGDGTPPYLCTSYDCYTLNEPCAMCAMALVHSRLRRIVYAFETGGGRGMLSSTTDGCRRLHACRSLNHHFVVYHMGCS